MIDSKNYIGTKNGAYIFQEVRDGAIRGFNEYIVIETVRGYRGLENTAWTHSVTLDGKTYKSGDAPAPVMEFPPKLGDLYEMETFSCDECGACHECEQCSNSSYVMFDSYVLCKECVKADDILVELSDAKSFFKAKDVQDIDLTGYEEIDTLFCDNSGFGSPGERALTKSQALDKVQEILDTENGPLYAGITGMGQFQVYVTIYRKV